MVAKMRQIDDPQRVLRELMRRDFRVFLRKAYSWIRGGERLLWNWHLDAIAFELERIQTGANRRLLVTIPPRNLKSTAISVAWVAWMLGHDPRQNFVCVSYSNELSGKLARDCLNIMQSHWYRELFPSTIISARRSASVDFETTRGGGRLATSITGTLTGRGGDTIVIDDPIKPDEAHSITTRTAVNHWFRSTLASRLNDKASGAIITVMQRLHQGDLAGVLLEAGAWHHLCLPAIARQDEQIRLGRDRVYLRPEGAVLHPAREPLHVLMQQKASMGSADFEAQYQQEPVPAFGLFVKSEWLGIYGHDFDPKSAGRIVQSLDTATKDGIANDFSVCVTAHVHRSQIRVLHVFRRRLEFPDLKRQAIRLAREWNAQTLLIEDAASGSQLIQTLRAEQVQGVPLPIACKPEGDKNSRMAGVTAQIEAGHLLLPADAPWLAEFKSELLGFPNARHDDQVDALTQLMSWVQRRHDDGLQPLGAPPMFFVGGQEV